MLSEVLNFFVDFNKYLVNDLGMGKYSNSFILCFKGKVFLIDSELFITEVPSEYVTESEMNAKGYLTSHQDISHLALKTDIPTVPTNVGAFANDKGYLTSVPSEYITETELMRKS